MRISAPRGIRKGIGITINKMIKELGRGRAEFPSSSDKRIIARPWSSNKNAINAVCALPVPLESRIAFEIKLGDKDN